MISGEEVEPPQKRTKLLSLLPPSHQQQQPRLSFTSLPNEIALNCFARMSKLYYPSLSIVSKNFFALLSSTELYVERSHIGNTEICLFLCLKFSTLHYTAPTNRWFSLWLKPRPNRVDGRFKEKSSGNLFVPFPSPPPPYSKSTVTIGSKIYLFGGPTDESSQPSSAVRVYDCRNHTWRELPNMKMERRHAYTCLLNDKIYVIGGSKAWIEHEHWFEMFDLKTQTWQTLASNLNPSQRLGYTVSKIGAVGGKIYMKTETGHIDWVYDVKENKWSVADVNLSHTWSSSWCVIENVMYCYSFGSSRYLWYDLEGRAWRDVKGLEMLRKFRSFSTVFPNCMVELVNYGGKLAVLWDRYERRGRSQNKNVWCAVVRLERYWPGGMVVGKIEWFDVVLTVPKSYDFLHCLTVSI